jgi:hypothetical protein
MAITHTTLMSNVQVDSNDVDKVVAVYNAILSAYTWETGSEVYDIANIAAIYGKYYFTANSYIKISNYVPHNYGVKIEIVTPSGTKTISLQDPYYMFSIGKTSKGICICAYSGANTSRNSQFYNLYVGEITKLDGSTAQGCIYAADDGTLTIATDSGISEESSQNSVISADKKAVLIPVVNTTTGDIFEGVFIMRYSPLRYNIMDVDGQGGFLCGKALALKD